MNLLNVPAQKDIMVTWFAYQILVLINVIHMSVLTDILEMNAYVVL